MSKVRAFVLGACLMTAALASQVGFAASPSQRECEAAGGTFTKQGGQVVCVMEETENVGNSPNSQTTTTTTTTSGQGNIDNKQQQSSDCSGPGNSDSSAHCK